MGLDHCSQARHDQKAKKADSGLQESADILGEIEELRDQLTGEQRLRAAAEQHAAALQQEVASLTAQVCALVALGL